MTSPAPGPRLLGDERAADLVDALLYSVSHDLRSPLLTLSLSGQLVRELIGPEAAEASGPALDGMQAAAADLERMLQALTVLSRARRRTLDVGPVALDVLLARIEVSGAVEGIDVEADTDLIRELVEWCGGSVSVERLPDAVRLVLPTPELPEHEGTPLLALVQSLQRYAGTPIERLAAFQVACARAGAGFAVDGERLVLQLPRAEASS